MIEAISNPINITNYRQQHCSNIASKNPKEYYRRAIVIHLLHRLTKEINFRFTKFSNRVSTLLCLIPSIVCLPDMNLDFHNAVSEHKEDLPHHEISDEEIRL